MKCQTIDEVIAELEKIIQQAIRTNDPNGFFAVVYYKVTKRVRDGILRKEFDQNALMEQLDVVFANRYLEAYQEFREKKTCSACWRTAFEASTSTQYIALQHILVGINAHINLDLGVAAFNVTQPNPLHTIQKNFFQINAVLEQMMNTVKEDLGRMSNGFKWLMPYARKLDERMMQFSIEIARDGAWDFANQLAADPAKQHQRLLERDQQISLLGQRILMPGRQLQFILSSIRLLEFKSVGKQLELLLG